jgi:hypothetical protein
MLVSISCHALDLVDRQIGGFCWWNSRICICIRLHLSEIAGFIAWPMLCLLNVDQDDPCAVSIALPYTAAFFVATATALQCTLAHAVFRY